jgi:hypothetical protein
VKRAFVVVAVLLTGSAWIYWQRTPEIVLPADGLPLPATTTLPPRSSSVADSPPAVPTPAPPTPLLEGDSAHQLLSDAVATLDAAQLPLLARYLSHPDASLRDAAREAIVQLGEPAGVALLQAAAGRAEDPEEARELRKSADFLALPSWSERRRQEARTPTPSGTRAPESP